MPSSHVLKQEPNSHSAHRQDSGVRGPVEAPRAFKVRLTLAFFFLAAFALSYGVVIAGGRLFVSGDRAKSELTSDENGSDDIVPDPLVVSSPGTALRVPHDPRLNPSGPGDFLFYIWFKLRKPLADGERAVFVAKYEPDSKARPGYSIALVGGPDGVRPNVYWQNEQEQGRWYPFASTQLRSKEWYQLAVSFRDSRYLGVHLMLHNHGKKPEVLGGYDLEPQVVPDTRADLIVGAFGVSKFRGRIGPFGIIRREKMTKDLTNLIAQMARSPGALPDTLASSEAVLVASPKQDQGELKLIIESSSARGVSTRGVSASGASASGVTSPQERNERRT